MQYKNSQKEIKKIIDRMAGKYSRYNIFRDFIVLAACAISNSMDKQQWKRREKMYMDTIAKYEKDEANKFAEMLALTVLAYESRMGDFIGELYMSMEFGNKHSGQFFTPYDVSKMMAQMLGIKENKYELITLNEPACGSGGMIVAYAETLKSHDINYQERLRVVCNDLDYDVVRMCYIQLSLLGIDAVVEQRNTLAPLDKPAGEVWYTPMHLLNKARKMQRDRAKTQVNAMKKFMEFEKESEPVKELELVGAIPGQMTIFDYLGG